MDKEDIITQAEEIVRERLAQIDRAETITINLQDLYWECEVCGFRNQAADYSQCKNCGC